MKIALGCTAKKPDMTPGHRLLLRAKAGEPATFVHDQGKTFLVLDEPFTSEEQALVTVRKVRGHLAIEAPDFTDVYILRDGASVFVFLKSLKEEVRQASDFAFPHDS